jgi:type I restriction enzyme S subunit
MTLPSQRELVKLKDVCDRITVGYVGPMAHRYTDVGVPFLRSQNIHPFRLSLDDIKFIPADFHKSTMKSALRPGDVAIVRTGYPGTACVIPNSLPEANCADLVVITPSPRLNARYLAAIFNSAWGKASVAGNLVGVAQQHFNVGAAKEMQVSLPTRDIQDRIADILSAYDDLIDNSQRRIRILEDMARRLYREWFVHFNFPNADGLPHIDSPLGPIPQGWRVATLPECIDINPKVRIPREGDKPFVPMGCLSNNSMLITDIESRSGNSGAKFQNGDTLFARITPCLENGKTGFVQFLPDAQSVAFGSTEFIVLRSRTLTPEFVYLLARSEPFRDNAIKSMTGASGRQRVQERCFDRYALAVPPPDLLARFSAIVGPSFKLIHQLHHQITNLRRTRDLLLPRLLSGELAVSGLRTEEPTP